MNAGLVYLHVEQFREYDTNIVIPHIELHSFQIWYGRATHHFKTPSIDIDCHHPVLTRHSQILDGALF